ncbi:DUF1496 domain-containing protein [Vibrio tapetis]|uniref:DUF1496 domain-containing protein n=1 Tax=Vibrio tapetis subsp. tapetis TaxID=1671868 RepID=A0A2N8ZMS9_9VIBR|nr:DUF1496 domain-containing protein [Vibrio tapetis]SON53192.1 conserved exported protein of unknown function [Vibrio tapetis subsp. tapetis]
MKSYLVGLLLIVVPISSAWSEGKSYGTSKTIVTPKNSVIVTDGKAGARICYYDDRAYSIGAVIQVGKVYLICQRQNDYELNGQLAWVLLNPNKPQ